MIEQPGHSSDECASRLAEEQDRLGERLSEAVDLFHAAKDRTGSQLARHSDRVRFLSLLTDMLLLDLRQFLREVDMPEDQTPNPPPGTAKL